jgi:methionine sulfoxide reductase heme-binding subunit
MSVSYQAVGWNRQKRIYDFILLGFCFIYLVLFITFTLVFNPEATFETLLIRSTSTLALLLLHLILCIGPLCRISPKFLPLLYNRRHVGVTMFCFAAVHGIFSIIQFHALGDINPIVSLFTSNTRFDAAASFPFQALGFVALLILFLMAITSHDFWLHHLTPKVWKTLHIMVYLAYFLVIMHVMLGVIQYETHPVYIVIIIAGTLTTGVLHVITGIKEHIKDRKRFRLEQDGFVKVCGIDEIEEDRAKMFCIDNERIAVYKTQQKLFAVNNVCKHQNGPLGEGKVIDGCITCPWHGYQYLPQNGSSPPPFKEKVSTYDVKIEGSEVWLNPRAYPEGTERPGAIIDITK